MGAELPNLVHRSDTTRCVGTHAVRRVSAHRVRQVRRAGRAPSKSARRSAGGARARSVQARGARGHAKRADARSVRARGARKHAGAPGAKYIYYSRPSRRPFFWCSLAGGRPRAAGRSSGAPGVGPQRHRASPAPPRTHAKHLSQRRAAWHLL